MGRLFSLGVVGNWSWKGVMPMKCLGVRPDTSKPPTRRITAFTKVSLLFSRLHLKRLQKLRFSSLFLTTLFSISFLDNFFMKPKEAPH